MPGTTINEVPAAPPVPGLDFFWLPGGAPGDPTYLYSDGSDSGARKCPVNTLITFTAVPGTRPGVSVTTYDWDFGDGTAASGPVVTHTFGFINAHLRVVLCITDSTGLRQCVGHQINLH